MRFYINSSTTELNSEKTEKEHIMVIGAGAAGQALIKEIINSYKLDAQVVCIIDDNPTKYGRILEGITIVGDRYQIPEMVKNTGSAALFMRFRQLLRKIERLS